MKVLFVHQNFPAQFANVAALLASRLDREVVAIGSNTARALPHIKLLRYGFTSDGLHSVHPFVRRLEIEARRAEQVLYIGSDLLASGFSPDVIFVHCGWGESLPLRSVFPAAKIVTYLEYFYQPQGLDTNFDPEWPGLSLDSAVALSIKNAASLLSLAEADVAISPTEWQRSTFPAAFRHLIEVCHEGIDVDHVRPNPHAVLDLPSGRKLRAGEEIVTYVSRNLEPLRGYHIFMRALARILRERPQAHIVIIGGDSVSYGLHPPPGRSWKDIFLAENRSGLDLDRVHFLGHVTYAVYLRTLQVSAAHVYLTYPFVMSWSLLEAMAAQCLVVASMTGPVQEVIDGTNGILTDFFDHDALAGHVIAALETPEAFQDRRRRARTTVADRYEKNNCLDRLAKIVNQL